MKKRIKIFILGAGGQIGYDLTDQLSKKYQIYAFCRNKKNLIKKNNIKYIFHDFINPLKLRIKPDLIINCIVNHEFSKKNDLASFINNNILSVKNIIEFVESKNCNFINLSSVAIYGNHNLNVLTEDCYSKNLGLLGVSKLFVETAFESKKLKCLNLRLPGVLCFNNDSQRPWLKNIIYKIKNNKTIKAFNINSDFNNLISTYEISQFISFIVDNKKFFHGKFNYSASKPIKLINILSKIKKFYFVNPKIINIKNNSKKSFIINCKKLEKKFKYKIPTTEKILLDYLENFENK